jgi:3,4-dihydroxyphthalate decarboxylase
VDLDELEQHRRDVALACRVLSSRRLAEGFLGHVSVRVGDRRLLVRCRGPRERGLAWTEVADIRLVTEAGRPGMPGELDGYAVPNELPLHTAILRARSDVAAVVHAHPKEVVAADLAGLGIVAMVGAYDIPGAQLARRGIPVFPSSVLVRDAVVARAVVEALGDHHALILRGHGLVTCGGTVQEAVLRAVSIGALADLALTVAAAGGSVVPRPDDELAQLPDLGSDFTVAMAWRHELARLGEA